MELVPFEQGAEPIKIGSGVRKVTLGRAEIKKSLNTKEKIRVSKDQIRLEIDHAKKIIQIETLGINPSSYGTFGDPPKPLKKDNKATGKDPMNQFVLPVCETGSRNRKSKIRW